MVAFLEKRLNEARQQSLHRKLKVSDGVDFYSNDYLGFARDQDFSARITNRLSDYNNEFFAGSTGSRLLSGNHALFEQVEGRLADLSGTQSAVFFPSGYQANVAVISALCRKKDVVFSDELNHASIIDGVRLSGADKEIFKHNSLSSLEEKLIKHQNNKTNKFIICESIYSMEGNQAPLVEIAMLAKKYDAHLIVDESHSTGLFAKNGSGLVNQLLLRDQVFCTIHTAGKALGVSGAWVAGSALLKEYIVNFSRGFVFSTAPSPVQFIMIDEALEYLKLSLHRAETVLKRAEYFRNELKTKLADTGAVILGKDSPIVPIVLFDNDIVLNLFEELKNLNIDIAAIRPPTVPIGKSRLRLTINHSNCSNHLNNMLDLLPKIIRKCM